MWDDGIDAAPAGNTNSFSNSTSRSASSGFSVGKGRGFGSFADVKNSLPEVGSNNFSSRNDSAGDAWDESAQGSNNSWQPQPNGDSKNNNSSWGNNKSENTWGSSGGGGSRSGGGKAPHTFSQEGGPRQRFQNMRTDGKVMRKGSVCFKCGEDGHMSRECPKGGGGGGGGRGSGCFKCGEDGHMSRDCPKGGGGGGGGRGCFKCGEDGHMSRECPNGGSGGGGGSSRGSACFKCGEDGHMSRECPSGGGGGAGRGSGCFKCGGEGHMSRECPNGGGGGDGGGGRGSGCFKCGEDGHMSRDCPSGGGQDKKGCFNCGEEGHMSRDCPTKSDDKRSKGCFNCGEEGHMSKDCTEPDKRLGPDGKPRPPLYIPPESSTNEDEIFASVPTGINFAKYDAIPVDVSGSNVPAPFSTFEQAKFCPTVAKNVQRSGYDKPTPVQKYAIPIILNKRDLMACAQTGSGKTAAFLLPMIQEMCMAQDLPNNSSNEVQEPWAVIVAPTRELAIQIYHEAQKFSHGSIVRSEVVYGGTSVGHQSSRIKKGCHILVATPGRLLDFVEKGRVSFEKVRYLVLDEADRMLDMGFVPTVRKMVEDPKMPQKGQRQTLMFSATFPEDIQKLAKDFLEDYLFLTVGMVGAANSDVEQTFFMVDKFSKREKLMEILRDIGSDRTLVFVEQKRTADFIASYTSQNNIPTTSIHGDRLQKEREEALRDFRIGKMPVLVATAVAARGLDIKDVCHVVNYDLPKSIDEYVHRIGRTGRVGNLGKATSFYDSGEDQALARSLKRILIDAQQPIPDWLNEEANNAVGTEQQYGGRSNFGSRDVRNEGRSNRGGGSDSWNNSSNNNNANNDVSQPIDADDAWD